jgi:tetratricopeptide (TPR) repeat protein
MGFLRAAFRRRQHAGPSLWTAAVLESFRTGGVRRRRPLSLLIVAVKSAASSHYKRLLGMALLVVGATGYGIYVWNQPPVVFIDQVAIHSSLTQFPYSDDVVRERVLREITSIQDQARTRFPRVSLERPRELPDFEIPATPFYLRTVAGWVEWALGREPTAIRVVVTRPIADFNKLSDPYLHEAEIRTIGPDTGPAVGVETVSLKATTPAELIAAVSREIVRRRSPYTLASYFESHGDNVRALDLVDAIIAGSDAPVKKWAFNLKGIVLSNLQCFERAREAVERAIQLDPEFAAAYNTKGIVLHNQGNHADALTAYEHALSLDSEGHSILLNRAIELGDVQRVDDAEQAFDELIRQTPGDTEIHFAKGRMLEDNQRLEGAVSAFDAAITIDPRHRDAQYEKGRVLIAMNELAKAYAANEEALKIDPAFAQAYINRAALKLIDKKFDEALVDANTAIALDGQSSEAYLTKGAILLAKGDPDDAWAANELALSIDPTSAKGYINRAQMYILAERFQQGLDASERAIALDPREPMGHFNKAQALLHLTNREKEALEAFARAASLSPGLHQAHFGRARAYAAMGSFEECRDELRDAIKTEPAEAEYHTLLAVCLASLGAKEDADRAGQRARELDQSDRRR